MNKFKLGQGVRCKLSGVEGYVDNICQYLFGMTRYCVQPKVREDGTLPDAYAFDEIVLEATGNESPIKPFPLETKLFKLGQIVKDPIAGIEVAITGYADYVTGCRRIFVKPMNKIGKDGEAYWIPEKQAVVVKGFNGKPRFIESVKPEDEEQVMLKRGGPAPCSKIKDSSKY